MEPDTILRLEPGVQHYPWGDAHFIPELLGIENLDGTPYAELWLGTHEDLPCHVTVDDERRLLRDVLDEDIPYLMKVLSAAKPLSIQAHPNEEQARDGFRREVAAGIPLDGPHRNYKDERAKPELLCALTDFYALRGFRPDLPELDEGSLKAHYEKLMTMPQADVDRRLAPGLERLQGKSLDKDDRGYWMLRCHQEFSDDGHCDRGLFSIDLLNLVHLKPGEAIFLDAGTLHAYLEGSAVEIMASSNNVLRGGLTRKHVDIPELLNVVLFESEEPEVLKASSMSRSEWKYPTPAREFELRRIVTPHENDGDHGPEILIVMEGDAVISPYHVRRGEAVCVPRGRAYVVDGSATIYKATVPSA